MNENDSVYEIFDQFMTTYDLYPHPVPGFPGYQCDQLGNVFKPNGDIIQPFNSNGYKQVCLYDEQHKRIVKGVHQVVAMTFDPSYYDGCVVHHGNEIKTDNYLENLEVSSRSEHSRHHADNGYNLKRWLEMNNGHSWNYGKKMNEEFREHCRMSALNRKNDSHIFKGNQFVDKNGNMKIMSVNDYNDFCDKCKKSAIARYK